jgi:hypothetical protein
MQNKVVVINAFEPDDFFISQLSRKYDNAVAEAKSFSELLIVSSMNFSFAAFPEQYTYDTLEPDLQKSVDAINSADVLAIFTSYRPEMSPVFSQFIARLFHLHKGGINTGIWGNISVHNKLVRIVTVIDDYNTWRKYKFKRDPSVLPIHKTDLSLFGFGTVATATYGYLQDNILNEYGFKQLSRMQLFGTADAIRPAT